MSGEYRISKWRRAGTSQVAALLCALLLAAQGAGLAHGHDDEPRWRLDCDICLGASASADAAIATEAAMAPERGQPAWLASAAGLPLASAPPAKSRSPPLC